MQNKHSIIRILGITTLIVLLLLFASSAVAEKPDHEKVFTDWAPLNMNSLLRSYNVIAFGDVTLNTHQNGGVLIKGIIIFIVLSYVLSTASGHNI